jgi:DNA-directed RNA polymerase subunit RPC12/RpoP
VNRLLVSTECPSCGAALDFSEGSNAVTCGHCRSNLLVTGKGQILSYSVAPRLDEKKAIALATMAQRNLGKNDFRILKSQMYFLPYYRLTGQDFEWEEPPAKPVQEEESSMEEAFDADTEIQGGFQIKDVSSLFEAAGELLGIFLKNPFGRSDTQDSVTGRMSSQEGRPSVPAGKTTPERLRHVQNGNEGVCKARSLYEKGEVVLNDRYVEKNFLACDLQGTGIYSLGIRPAVLKLELFRKEALGEAGRLVSPTVAPDAALEVGLRTATNSALLYRQVIGKVLSIVYFPFWIIETEDRGETSVTIIDAVAQTVIKPDASPSIYAVLDRQFADNPQVIGFRPLTCPNCGWDFPVRPDDSVFFCGTCKKAWEVRERELCGINFEIAGMSNGKSSDALQYLPFWIIGCGAETEKLFRYYIPAFRYRRLKLLLDLALCLTRTQPDFPRIEAGEQSLSGCYYDSRDAATLTRFARLALKADDIETYKACGADDLHMTGAALIWLPFEIKGTYLLSPFAQISIPRNLLF